MSLLGLAVCVAATLFAQSDEEKARMKKEILRKVEESIRAEEARILKSVEALLDREYGASPKPQDKPASGRGYLGIRPIEVPEDEREELKLKPEDGGVKIAEILADTPADGKLESDDIILKLNGDTIKSVDALIAAVQKAGAGTEITLTVLREKKRQDVKVKLAANPEDSAKEEPKKEEPKKEEPKKEEKKEQDIGKKDLRDRIKKFLDQDESKPPQAKKPEGGVQDELEKRLDELIEGLAQSDQFQGLVDEMRSWIEKMGMNPDQFFQKDGAKWKPTEEYKQVFKMVPREFEKVLQQLKDKVAPEARKEEPPKPVVKAKRPFIGILVEDLSDEDRKKAGLEEGLGLLVTTVREKSPAEKAGIKKGDVLVRIGKDPARGENALKKFMASAKVGEEVELVLLREGKEIKAKLVLDERKEN